MSNKKCFIFYLCMLPTREFAVTTIRLLTPPTTIVGGILSGIFTPTESAIDAVVYALILGLFVYRSLTWRQI